VSKANEILLRFHRSRAGGENPSTLTLVIRQNCSIRQSRQAIKVNINE
jgi:hypothetical protein